MAFQLPARPTIYEADPFGAFKEGLGIGKGIKDELNARDAFGQYVDSLKSSGKQSAPGPARNLSLSALDAINTAAPSAPQEAATISTGYNSYLDSIRAAESGGNDMARNPNSSATGRYQFIDSTWQGLMRNHPELGLTADGRTDPAQQERAIRAFTQDNARMLAGQGIQVNPGNLYAAHFLGAGGASNVLGQQDNTPVSAYLDASVVQANPFLANMSVGDFKQWAASKGGGASGGYQAPMDPMAGIPQATGPKFTLPPADVMRALFRSPDTRQIAIQLAQGAQQGMDASTMQTFARPDGSVWQFNPATGEIGVVQDALDRQARQAQIDQAGIPSGYRRNAVGGLEPVPGGPADPANPLNAKRTTEAPNIQTRYNPITGLEEKVQWNSATGAWEPFGGSKAPTNGLTVTTNPDGTTTVTQGGSGKPLTEGQSKDAVYATRAAGALPIIDQFGGSLTNPVERAVESDPTGVVRGMVQSPDFQQAQQAGMEFLQAILRKDTGAAITNSEQEEYGKVYLPRPGDSPQLLEQKRLSRVRALEALRAGMPPQAILNSERALQNTDASTALPTAGQPSRPVTQQDFDALPSGALYIDPDDGKTYRKP